MLRQMIEFLLSNVGIVMLIIALFCIAAQRITYPSILFSEITYRWIALLPLGITALYAFAMHAFFPDIAATAIGWQNSPFQFEVAMANLGFGMLGVLSFNADYNFRLATVIGNTCWLWGDAVGHIYQMLSYHNFTIGNAGSWFWLDVLIPLVLIICIINLKKTKGSSTKMA